MQKKIVVYNTYGLPPNQSAMKYFLAIFWPKQNQLMRMTTNKKRNHTIGENKMNMFVILTGLFLGACSSMSVVDRERILNSDLNKAYNNLDVTFHYARAKLLFDNNSSAKDCPSYLKLIKISDLVESVNNKLVKSEYLMCDAIEILSRSRPIPNFASPQFYGDKILTNLDLRSFPSSMSRASDDQNYTLKSLFPLKVGSSKNVAFYESSDWSFRVEVVAESYINENDVLDWIVWVSDESKNGNYKSYFTLIISDPSENESYQAILYR